MKTLDQCYALAKEALHFFKGATEFKFVEIPRHFSVSRANLAALKVEFETLSELVLDDGEFELFDIYRVSGLLQLGAAYCAAGKEPPVLIRIDVSEWDDTFGGAPNSIWIAGLETPTNSEVAQFMSGWSAALKWTWEVEK